MVPWLTREHLREELASFMHELLEPELNALGQRVLEAVQSELAGARQKWLKQQSAESLKSTDMDKSVTFVPNAASCIPSTDRSEIDKLMSMPSRLPSEQRNSVHSVRASLVSSTPSQGVRMSSSQPSQRASLASSLLSRHSSRHSVSSHGRSKKGGAHRERVMRRLSEAYGSEGRRSSLSCDAGLEENGPVVEARWSVASTLQDEYLGLRIAQDENSFSWMKRHRKIYKEPVYNVLEDWQAQTSLSSAATGAATPVQEDSPYSSCAEDNDEESVPVAAPVAATSFVQAVAPTWVKAASGWVSRAGARVWKQRHQESYRQLHLTQSLVINALSPRIEEEDRLNVKCALSSTSVMSSASYMPSEVEEGNGLAIDPTRQGQQCVKGQTGALSADIQADLEVQNRAFRADVGKLRSGVSRSGSDLDGTPRDIESPELSVQPMSSIISNQSYRAQNWRSSTGLSAPTMKRTSIGRRGTRRLSEDILQFANVHVDHIHQASLARLRSSTGNYFEDTESMKVQNEDLRSSMYVLMAHVVQSPAFAYCVSVLVLLNAALIGVQTDFMARHWTVEVPAGFDILEKMLCVLFTCELVMRFYVFGCANFFSMPGWKANIFDLAVISFQVFDEFVLAHVTWLNGLAEVRSPLWTMGSVSSWPLVRMLRLLRLVRIASLLHLLTELRMLVISIADSIKSVVWVLFLLFMIMYCIGVYFTQVVTIYKVAQSRNGNHVQPVLENNYGTLLQTMLSLFESIASGVSWREVMDPLWQLCSPWMLVLFLGYVFFTIFVVLNVVTGVFVGSATEKANEDQKKVLMYQLRELFRSADIDNEGTMTWTKFQNQLQDPKMQAYLKAIDLDQEEALDLFHLLDSDDSDEIDEDEFVNGCIRLHGYAKSIDLATFMFDYKNYTNMWSEHAYRIERQLEEIAERLQMALREAETTYDVSV